MKGMNTEETFEEYQARLAKLELRAKMHRDGFFRAKAPKREIGIDEVLY